MYEGSGNNLPRHIATRRQTVLPGLQTAQRHNALVLRLIFAKGPTIVVCLVQVELLSGRDSYTVNSFLNSERFHAPSDQRQSTQHTRRSRAKDVPSSSSKVRTKPTFTLTIIPSARPI